MFAAETCSRRVERMRTLEKFAAVHSPIRNQFNKDRHLTDEDTFKLNRAAARTGDGVIFFDPQEDCDDNGQ